MTETKIVELIIQDENQELAIDAISLVTSPAIEQDFVFFGKEKNNLTFAKVDEEKRMLVSPALIPNKNIFRHDPNTDSDYYVYFSKETVRKASELYLKHNNHHKATYQHQDRVSGILTVESWIIEDTKLDKSTLYGYSLPVGTWMVKLSISNDEIWSKIKSGELKGLSIEQILKALNELVRENKTELKAEKIELGVMDDIKSRAGALQKDIATLGKTRTEIMKANKKAKAAFNILEFTTKAQKKELSKAKSAFKELGLDAKPLKAYEVQVKEAEQEIKDFKKLIS
jgi:hypothetical protein